MLVGFFVLGSMIMVGCNSSGGGTTSNDEPPIKIGMIASLSGEQQPWGEDSRNGAELAVEEFNAAGGVNGRKVELIVGDTASKPESGKSATEKLVGVNKVLAVIGEVASGITIQA